MIFIPRKVSAYALAVCCFLVSCQSKLYYPPEVRPLSNALKLTIASDVRKNDCVEFEVALQDPGGAVMTTVDALTVDLETSTAGRIYTSLLGCQWQREDEQVTELTIAAGQSAVHGFFRTVAAGTVSIKSTAEKFGASEQTVVATTQNFSRAKGADQSAYPVALDPSTGKVYLGGNFLTFDDQYVGKFARLNTDGTLDASFKLQGTGLDGVVDGALVQPDGRIIVYGNFTTYNGISSPRMVRLNTDGSLDPTFAPTGTGFNSIVYDAVLQPDGKILVGGNYNAYNGIAQKSVSRLNADGTLDNTFAQTGTGLNSIVIAIARQADGRVLAGGFFTDYNGTSRPRIVRLNVDGSLDASFNPGTGFNINPTAIVVQNDGQILAVGSFTTYNGTTVPRSVRLNPNGSIDSSFAPVGTAFNNGIGDVKIQPDGRLVVSGSFSSYNGTSRNYLARLNSDGSLDPTFVQTGTGLNSTAGSIILQADGRIVIGGNFTGYNNQPTARLARFSSTGQFENAYGPKISGFDNSITTIAVQDDGSVVVGGFFNYYSENRLSKIARLNRDGTLDTTFVPVGNSFNTSFLAGVAVQPDHKILAAGGFNNYNGVARYYIARLNVDGTLDPSFTQTGTGLDSYNNAIALQSDGKVLVGGAFTSYNGTSRARIARLNTDGSLDTSFAQTGTGLGGIVNTIALQNDGRVVVGGTFTTYNGTATPYIVRLNADGSQDNSFAQSGTGLNAAVSSIAVQSDGRIVVGGSFTNYNGISRPYLARLNSDGSLDATFAPTSTGLNAAVSAVLSLPDLRVVVVGAFTAYDGTSSGRIIALETDGRLDTSFAASGTLFSANPSALALQAPGQILVGGQFTSFSNDTVPRLGRLTSQGELD